MRRSILLASLLSLVVTTVASAAEKEVRHRFQSATARGQVRRVLIEIPAGSIAVVNGPADRLAVAGETIRTIDVEGERKRAQAMVDGTSVEIYVSGSEAIVRRKFTGAGDTWRSRKFTEVKVVVEVPPGTNVEFETSAGEVKLEGSFGDVDVDLSAGAITMHTPKSIVKELRASCRVGSVHTNLGHQIVDREGVFPGRTEYRNPAGTSRIRLHTTAGEVNVTLTQ